MTIKVFDFRTIGKLSINACYDSLVNNADFLMMVSKDGVFKEFRVSIPKRYHFIVLTNAKEYRQSKAREYDVLKDFILDHKRMLCDKWNLNDSEYEELLEGLYVCLIEEYGRQPEFIKRFMLFPISFKKFVSRIFGGIRVC